MVRRLCLSNQQAHQVNAEHDICVCACAFKLDAREQRCAVACCHQLQITVAGGFEGFFYGGARAPIGHEAVVGVNGVRPAARMRFFIVISICCYRRVAGVGYGPDLPSAGMIRFRFDGSRICVSQTVGVAPPR